MYTASVEFLDIQIAAQLIQWAFWEIPKDITVYALFLMNI